MSQNILLVVLLLSVVPCEPFAFNLQWKTNGRANGLPSASRASLRARLIEMSASSTRGSFARETPHAQETLDSSGISFENLESVSQRSRFASTAFAAALLFAAQPADAYFQTLCPGGAHLNHLRTTSTKAVNVEPPQTKRSLMTDRCCSPFPEDADAVSVASSLEGVLHSDFAREENFPALTRKSVEDIGPLQNMGFAFIASAISTMTMHPIDTMKTRIQRRKDSAGDLSSGKSEGSLYEGLLANVAREGPCNALYLGVYEAVKKVLFRNPSTTGMAQHWPIMAFLTAGAIGDCAGCLVSMPAEIVKRKVQAGVSKSYVEAVVDAVRTESARAMTMASASAVLVRDIPEGALQMALYEEWKLSALPVLHAVMPAMDSLVLDGLVGAAAGGVAAVLTTPLDVVLTRLSTQRDGGKAERGMGVGECMREIVDEEGMGGLWKGAAHRAGYYAPLIGIFFGAFGWLQSLAVDEGKAYVLVHTVQAELAHVLHLA